MTTVNGVSTEEAITNNIRSYPSFPYVYVHLGKKETVIPVRKRRKESYSAEMLMQIAFRMGVLRKVIGFFPPCCGRPLLLLIGTHSPVMWESGVSDSANFNGEEEEESSGQDRRRFSRPAAREKKGGGSLKFHIFGSREGGKQK